ncbi:MAG: hypothetical protein H6838_13975 [Planctomycetes bacterium]|nr:hypothetical protein [Planctomycetota bacterium]MCB9886597.1 hypothetical protein [Planctomycetota bacterium]
MKRVLLWLSLAIAAFFVGRAAYRAFVGDRTKIDWLLAEEAAAFNEASMLTVMPNFAADFRDGTSGIDGQSLRGAVVWAWQNRRDAEGNFAWRVDLPEGSGEVLIDGDAATATFPLHLSTEGGAVWELEVQAELQKRDGRWWLTGSRHTTKAGKAPGLR